MEEQTVVHPELGELVEKLRKLNPYACIMSSEHAIYSYNSPRELCLPEGYDYSIQHGLINTATKARVIFDQIKITKRW